MWKYSTKFKKGRCHCDGCSASGNCADKVWIANIIARLRIYNADTSCIYSNLLTHNTLSIGLVDRIDHGDFYTRDGMDARSLLYIDISTPGYSGILYISSPYGICAVDHLIGKYNIRRMS